jgi:hypothetical protein
MGQAHSYGGKSSNCDHCIPGPVLLRVLGMLNNLTCSGPHAHAGMLQACTRSTFLYMTAVLQ